MRRDLVVRLREFGAIRDERVAEAFGVVPREAFLPDHVVNGNLESVYQDRPIILKRDARNVPTSASSQPAIMAVMLELLGVGRGDRVLEIGTGSGYNAALLAELVRAEGRVISVELDDELAARARTALAKSAPAVEVVTNDGHLGWAERAPYDGIIVTASTDLPPSAWHEQLKEGGRLVLPMRFGVGPNQWQCVIAFERVHKAFRSVRLVPGGFMHLRHGDTEESAVRLPVALTITDQAPSGPRTMNLSGMRLEQLTPAARKRLLAILMSKPTQQTLSSSPGRTAELNFLLNDDERVHLFTTMHGPQMGTARAGIGLVATGGSGAAFVTSDSSKLRLVSFGDAAQLAKRLTRVVRSLQDGRAPLVAVTYGRRRVDRGSRILTCSDGVTVSLLSPASNAGPRIASS